MEEINSEFNKIVVNKELLNKQIVNNLPKNIIKNPVKNSIKKESNGLKIFGIFVLLVGILGFCYLAYDGQFKSIQEVHLTPNNTIQVDNQFEFSPQTENIYNMTLTPDYTINIYLDSELLNLTN